MQCFKILNTANKKVRNLFTVHFKTTQYFCFKETFYEVAKFIWYEFIQSCSYV